MHTSLIKVTLVVPLLVIAFSGIPIPMASSQTQNQTQIQGRHLATLV